MESLEISLKGLVFWHWFIVLGVFLVLELMVPGFFFIWLAAAAGTGRVFLSLAVVRD